MGFGDKVTTKPEIVLVYINVHAGFGGNSDLSLAGDGVVHRVVPVPSIHTASHYGGMRKS